MELHLHPITVVIHNNTQFHIRMGHLAVIHLLQYHIIICINNRIHNNIYRTSRVAPEALAAHKTLVSIHKKMNTGKVLWVDRHHHHQVDIIRFTDVIIIQIQILIPIAMGIPLCNSRHLVANHNNNQDRRLDRVVA